MSNLNNLISKILNDAKEEADKIVKSAEEKAKQTVINKVIDKLKAKLVNMNESDYINYLNQNIDKSSIAGKELIVKKEFVEKVKKEFPTAKVKKNEFVTSGFVIEENGVQENYTFEVKLDFMRDELEVEISKLLFS